MTTEPFDPCADSGCSSDFTSEALCASNEQRAAHPKNPAEPISLVPHHTRSHQDDTLFQTALIHLTKATADMAAKKNIPLTPDERDAVARQATLRMLRGELQRVLAMAPDAVRLAARAINHMLDVFAACRVSSARPRPR
jgi:hypothetical protein